MRYMFSLFLAFCLPVVAADKPSAVAVSNLVANTLAANPEVKFYEAEIAAAKAGRRTAGRLTNPELNLELGRKHASSGDATGEGLAYAITLAQPIEWPGRLGLRKAIANGDIALAELGLARFRAFLAGRVRVLGYALALRQEIAAASAEVADRFSAVKEVLVQREPAGIAPLLETKIIEAASVGVQRRAGQAEVEMQKALLELNQLMGRRADTPLVVTRTEFNVGTVPKLESLLAKAAENNYELRIRRAEFEQQGLKVSLAKNERFPTFGVGPAVSQERAGEHETIVGVGISVPLPLWNTGKANVDAATARRAQAEATLNAAAREVQRKVTEAALVLQTQRERLDLWKLEMLQSFRDAAALADRHYRLGAVQVSSYLEMQDRYLEAVEAISETRLEVLQAAIDLEQLIGTPAVEAKSQP